MSASPQITERLAQLALARTLVLQDPVHYPQVVLGLLHVFGPNEPLPLRRWGAEFLAETFAAPAFPAVDKEELALQVLGVLQGLMENTGTSEEDESVIKCTVQACASVYPLIFRHM
jgi:symplekin